MEPWTTSSWSPVVIVDRRARTPRTPRFYRGRVGGIRGRYSVPSHFSPTSLSLAPISDSLATIDLFPSFLGNSTGREPQLATVPAHTFEDGQPVEAVAVEEAQHFAP